MKRFAINFSLLLSSAAVLAMPVPAFSEKPVRSRDSQAAALSPIDIPFEKFVLPNGLTVIVHEDRKTPVVSVGIWYHVGSANETPGRTGFAHLFEHLMFNGSEHANDDWFQVMNEVGASQMNGSTFFDRTNYYQTVPTQALDRLLWLESDRMENLLPAIDQAKLDEQRKVVQNEKRQRANNPLGEVPDMLYAAIYPAGHPYSWTPIGSMEDLDAATLDDVRDFFKKWYGAGNAVLVLSGDISSADAKTKAEKYFGNIPGGPALKRSAEQPAKMVGETRGVIQVPTANSQLFKVWNLPGWTSDETQLVELAASALSNGENSRFKKRIVRELQLASTVDLSITRLELGSQLQLSATARPGVSLAQLEAAIDEEMAAFLREGISSTELDRVKLQIYASRVRGQTSTLDKAITLAEAELYAGTPAFNQKLEKFVYEATPAQVLAASRKWLSDGVYVLEARALPQYAISGQPVDRSAKPAIGPAANFNLPPLQHATLSNGIQVALAERHDVPTINLSMVFGVGSLPDRNPASVGVSTAVNLTTAGTTTRSKLEISAAMENLGALIGWQTTQETTRFGLSALNVKLEDSLDLYADILLNPVFPAEEWNRLRDLFVAGYEDMKRTPAGKLAPVAPKMIYGPDHPYAAHLTPDIAQKLTTEDFRAFYEKWIRPDLATILIVGDTTLAEILPKLEKRLAVWKVPTEPAPVKPPLPAPLRPAKPRIVLIDQPGAESSVIGVGHTGPARNDPDFDRLSVVNTVMGGHFVSRLNMNLREEKGWSYGMKSDLGEVPLLGMIGAGGLVQTDKTADALREIARELREVATTRPPTAAEIAAAKNAMLLGLPAYLQDPTGPLGMYRQTYEYRLPDDYWNGYIQTIEAYTTADIDAAARRLYRPNELTWFVVGDLGKFEAEVRKLNLGDVQVMNENGERVR
jgi:zinc protease